MDSRWHECGHGTAFRTKWKNDVVYQIASFCMVRNPVEWRWSHARHHTDTIIVGRDPEILAMRPPALRRILLNLFGIVDVMQGWRRMAVNAAGHIDADIASFIPEREKPKLIATARVWCAHISWRTGALPRNRLAPAAHGDRSAKAVRGPGTMCLPASCNMPGLPRT